ncbi:GTP-binding protein of the ras family [Scheffersomyces amazonensis]|uniref:GTP-binding protein of the ras family n=1 Tax=Scheffersomyces amazonensis TaxID=1078765 RepID=UPI00315DF26E
MNSIQTLKDNFDILVIGDHQVGKSSLILNYLHDTFINDIDASVEDLHTKVISENNEYYELSILDTSSVTDSYARSRQKQIINASTLLLVYSTTNTESLLHLHDIYDKILSIRPLLPPIVVVGTKFDLVDERQVSWEEGHEFSKNINSVGFFECSAKSNVNVDEAFQRLADIVLSRHQADVQQQKRAKSITVMDPVISNNTINDSIIIVTSESSGSLTEQPQKSKSAPEIRKIQSQVKTEQITKSGCCIIM